MTLIKVLLNSIIFAENAQCVILDVKDFYLNTPMKRFKYMWLKLNDIPEEIIIQYKLHEIATEDRYVYCKFQKGMYGLPQAGIIAQDLLQACSAKLGYHQSKIIPGLWTHKTRKTCFTLVIDDFAIKYASMEDGQHLVDALIKITPSHLAGMQQNSLDLPLNGTTRTKRSMPTCQDIFKWHYFDSSTKHQKQIKTHRIHM